MHRHKISKINPFNNKNKLINKNDIQNVLKKYGIFQNINNLGIYQEAFTHESYSLPHIQKAIDRDNLKLADKLDGVEGSNYLRSDTSDTLNGNLTLNDSIIHKQ